MSGKVIVVGAGFGGLSTAIVLARLGLDVTVVERERHPGGCMRSYVREGVDCPVGVHYFGAAAPGELLGDFLTLLGIRDQLKLRRLGGSGVIDRYCFDEEVFDLPDTASKLEASLTQRFPDRPDAVAFVMKICRGAMSLLRSDELASARPLLPMTKTAAEVLSEANLPGRLVDILALQGFLLGTRLSACPAGFLMVASASLLMSAWELGCTGIGMASAMVESAVDSGVKFLVEDPVVEITVGGGQACGVVLGSGASLRADVVVAGIHPKALVGLLPASALPADYRSGIARLKETAGALCVVALLDEKHHPARDHNLYRVRGDARNDLQGVYAQLRASGRPGYSRLTLLTESPYADWSVWHGTTTGQRGLPYRAEKSRCAHLALEQIAEILGPLDTAQIIDTWTPLTMRDWVGAPEGGTYGVRHAIDDGLAYMVLSRPPLGSLYLVGQNAIAPGLLGTSMGVLRVAGAIVGKDALARLVSKHRSQGRDG